MAEEAQEFSEFALFASTKKRRNLLIDCSENNEKKSNNCSIEGLLLDRRLGFPDMHLDPWLIQVLASISIHLPTEIQRESFNPLVNGNDLIAAAKTGSGKTAAFALPILQKLSKSPFGYFAIILTPTRELAIQISAQFELLGTPIKCQVCLAVGGMDMLKQSSEIDRKPHIIVATPGRLADILSSCHITLKNLKYLVFDEADRLLGSESSFLIDEIPQIISKITSHDASWSYFSATITDDVYKFHKEHRSTTAFVFDGNKEHGTVDHLNQSFILVPSIAREAYLVQLLRGSLLNSSVIIFTGKCKNSEFLLRTLQALNIKAVALHGQMLQKHRIAALDKFKSGICRILISTDVGSRGLDIPIVDTVINFDIPADPRDYVHRVGRAARAGRPGSSISLVNELDMTIWKAIETKIGKKITLYTNGPTEAQALNILNEVTTAKRSAGMVLHDTKFGEKRQINRKKWKQKSSDSQLNNN